MAIGFGPASEMVRKVNKQKGSRNKRSLKESSENTAIGSEEDAGLKFKESSPEHLEQVREKMKAQNQKKLMLTIVLSALIIVAAVCGVIYL
ncbi:MAG: hypothetical protein ACI8ZM_000812 [Crocinitomix sp.]|jgi:hypothetical protein